VRARLIIVDEMPQRTLSLLQCSKCRVKFSTRDTLSLHACPKDDNLHARPTNVTPFPCRYHLCLKQFNSPKTREIHEAHAHRGNRYTETDDEDDDGTAFDLHRPSISIFIL
jgi:hypothetical protein